MREKLPKIDAATALDALRLELQFADGWRAIVDLSAFVASFVSLAPLADRTVFAKAAVEEWGSGVTWDNEGPLSIAAVTLYRLASAQSGDEARIFDAWMARHGFSASRAAEMLGMTRRSVIAYRTGARPIPKVVGLACRAIDLETHPDSPVMPRRSALAGDNASFQSAKAIDDVTTCSARRASCRS